MYTSTESAALIQNEREEKQIVNEIQKASDEKIWLWETCCMTIPEVKKSKHAIQETKTNQ